MDELARELADSRFNVIHVFRLAMMPFAKAFLETTGQAPALHLDLDDVESVTGRRLAGIYRRAGNHRDARLQERMASRAEAIETEVMGTFDRVYVCSDGDRELLAGRSKARICVVPNAVPAPEGGPMKRAGRPFTFLFVGTLGYFPNEDGVRFFCKDVLPLMKRDATRDVRVVIVGAGASRSLLQLGRSPDVHFVGNVPDVASWYAQADVAIIPLRAGGGMRIKVLEAFRYRCPVVSTSIGMEGIAVQDGAPALIGDTPELFAAQCLRLMQDPALGDRLTNNAMALLIQSYTLEAVAGALDACHSETRQSAADW
jgi:glycosyltransferase involved in cell wall biosynthesis